MTIKISPFIAVHLNLGFLSIGKEKWASLINYMYTPGKTRSLNIALHLLITVEA